MWLAEDGTFNCHTISGKCSGTRFPQQSLLVTLSVETRFNLKASCISHDAIQIYVRRQVDEKPICSHFPRCQELDSPIDPALDYSGSNL
jgi:hypothetical protein